MPNLSNTPRFSEEWLNQAWSGVTTTAIEFNPTAPTREDVFEEYMSMKDGLVGPKPTPKPTFDWPKEDRIMATFMEIRRGLMKEFKHIGVERVARDKTQFIGLNSYRVATHAGRQFNWERDLIEREDATGIQVGGVAYMGYYTKDPAKFVFFDHVTRRDGDFQELSVKVEKFLKQYLPVVEIEHVTKLPEQFRFNTGSKVTPEALSKMFDMAEPILQPTSKSDTISPEEIIQRYTSGYTWLANDNPF